MEQGNDQMIMQSDLLAAVLVLQCCVQFINDSSSELELEIFVVNCHSKALCCNKYHPKKNGVQIELKTQANPTFMGSPQDLRTVLRNILENALKFSGRPGLVRVTLTDRFLTVEDNGSGIPDALRCQVFERFFQAEKAAGRANGQGAGLGLSIVQSIAKRNRFSVTAEQSETLSGACFRVVWTDHERPEQTKL